MIKAKNPDTRPPGFFCMAEKIVFYTMLRLIPILQFSKLPPKPLGYFSVSDCNLLYHKGRDLAIGKNIKFM